MVKDQNNIDAFFALVRCGLWEEDVQILPYGTIDFSSILELAEAQSVVGLVAAGLEHVLDVKVSKEIALQFVGQALQLEQKNNSMNSFIRVLVEKMRRGCVCTLLIKGQSIAQCYSRPLWRSCGDVDLFLSDENYEKAKAFLLPLASSVEEEYVREKHCGMTIDGQVVELHGRLYSGLSSQI